jgi:uncharacterized protein
MTNRQRAAFDLSLFLAAFFILWTLRATVFFGVDESIASPKWRAAYSDLLKLVLWVLPAAGYGFWLRGARPAKYLGLSVLPSSRNWLWCLAITSTFLLATTVSELAKGKSFSTSGLSALPPVLVLLQLVISPLLEELFFRGMVLRELLGVLPIFFALLLNSVLFVGAHLPYWLSHGGATRAVWANSFGIFVFSVLAGWLFTRGGSVWPPTLAHVANNVLSAVLVANQP